MKEIIQLTPDEIATLAVQKLIDLGKISYNNVNVNWDVNPWSFKQSTITISEVKQYGRYEMVYIQCRI